MTLPGRWYIGAQERSAHPHIQLRRFMLISLVVATFGRFFGSFRHHRESKIWQPRISLQYAYLQYNTVGDFTFLISLSLRPSLSPKYGLRPKISEK